MSTPNTATTDVGEFITDLDAGMFDRKLSAALSQVAAAVVDHDKAGEVSIKLAFKRVTNTQQVHVTHQLKYTRPTLDGKASEEEARISTLHVGKGGRLSLLPETQGVLFDRAGAATTPTNAKSNA